MTKDLRHSFKMSKSGVSVQSKLGVGVPNGKVKQKIQNVVVLVIWKQTLKYGQCALPRVSANSSVTTDKKERTCNRSSKSRATNAFMPEVLA